MNIEYSARILHISGRTLFDAVPHYPVQVIQPQLALVLARETNDIMAAGTLVEYRRILRDRGKTNNHIYSWPKFYTLEFERGLEPLQVQPFGDGSSLAVNAAGMLKLFVQFDGKLNRFLSGNSLNNARNFLRHVAGDGEKGSVARYSASRLDWAARWMIEP